MDIDSIEKKDGFGPPNFKDIKTPIQWTSRQIDWILQRLCYSKMV